MKYSLVVLTFLFLMACSSSKTYYRSGKAAYFPVEIANSVGVSSLDSVIVLTIFDIKGDIIATYTDIQPILRRYNSDYSPEQLPAGIYFTRISKGDITCITKKLSIR
ncbi:MAG: hypothetical protein SF052_21110 [Bacteroidia bacterium]|nr:hypothetical protein [Bacteroidia bacterium]